MSAEQMLGSWPYVDIVLVKDYVQPSEEKSPAQCFLRIHMDIPIPEAKVRELDDMLMNADNAKVLDTVLKTASAPKPNTNGLATLQAALGQLRAR
jgi:hypothetical protein